MAVAEEKSLLSAQEFMHVYGESRYELVRGKLAKVSPPDYVHGIVLTNIACTLSDYGKITGFGYALAGDLGVWTERDADTVRGADIAFYSHKRLPLHFENPQLPVVVPDVVAEVYPQTNRPAEILPKVSEYLNAGVLAVWVVYPQKRCLVIYRPDDAPPTLLRETDIVQNHPELPGFECRVTEFFE